MTEAQSANWPSQSGPWKSRRELKDMAVPPYQPLEDALEHKQPHELRKIAARYLHIDPVYIAPPVVVGPMAEALSRALEIPGVPPFSTVVIAMQRKDGTYWVYYDAANLQAVLQELGPDFEVNCVVYQDPTQ